MNWLAVSFGLAGLACFLVGFLFIDRAARSGPRSRRLACGAFLALVLGSMSLVAAGNIWLLSDFMSLRGP